MPRLLHRYTKWLHTQWPAGTVERLPDVREDGSTTLPGLYVVGDLTGIPLLKFSADSGAKAVRRILQDLPPRETPPSEYDLIIIGAGVSGMAAVLEAQKHHLRFLLLEASEPFSTIVNFPKAKPIYTYPTEMTPAGDLQFTADVKEALVDELRRQTLDKGITPTLAKVDRVSRNGNRLEVHLSSPEPQTPTPEEKRDGSVFHISPSDGPLRASAVIVAIGRSGNFRRLNVPGEDLDKVYNRLHDPKDFDGKNVLVVGGGDSALETAIALTECGARVTLSYRKPEFSRPKPDNVERLNKLLNQTHRPPDGVPQKEMPDIENPSSERVTTAVGGYMDQFRHPGSLTLALNTTVTEITPTSVTLAPAEKSSSLLPPPSSLPNDAVFTMIGREAPLDFFRKSRVPIRGEWTAKRWISLVLVLALFTFIYHWKKTGLAHGNLPGLKQVVSIGDDWSRRNWFPYNLPAWWGSLGGAFDRSSNLLGTLKISLGEPGFFYSLAYCAAVTAFGIARIRRRKTPYVKLQTWTLIAIQIVPLFLLPYILLPWAGHNHWFDAGFGKTVADALFPAATYGHGREYWRSFGFVLAWPLFFWNVFTDQPLWTWLAISFIQTFAIIPALIYFYGKGAYCGWICSCGALAETLGDAHRHKMPHGPAWNRFNMLGQAFLAFAFLLLAFRILGWVWHPADNAFQLLFKKIPVVNYVWFVDLLWAGILGVGLYWHFSGRVWCRFACPLAALMHVYARFSRFRILADKKKCISCNVCTTVCHQGIDVMNFANKGLPMADPQCVRCSACVQSCPTGVLSFGQIDPKTGNTIKTDKLGASPVLMTELTVNGKKPSPSRKELVNA